MATGLAPFQQRKETMKQKTKNILAVICRVGVAVAEALWYESKPKGRKRKPRDASKRTSG
jgi:hypothetical protein